ncbi:MAG: MaoC family dehydratase [Candidatus Neomarinimicrobiota bacterium]
MKTYTIGDSATIEHVFQSQDVEVFAQLSGDNNPIHLDSDYAATTRFKSRIVHGMLVGSLFSTIFGTVFPGEGAVYLGQSLKFTAPVFLGEKITATVTLISLREDKPIGTFETICRNESGTPVIKGEATLLLP